MLGMTGYSDYRELASGLFQVLAVLEIVCQSQIELNEVLSKRLDTDQSTIDHDQENQKLNWIETFLKLIKSFKCSQHLLA